MDIDPLERHRSYHPTVTWSAAGLVRKTECKADLCGFLSFPDDEPLRTNNRLERKFDVEQRAEDSLIHDAVFKAVEAGRG